MKEHAKVNGKIVPIFRFHDKVFEIKPDEKVRGTCRGCYFDQSGAEHSCTDLIEEEEKQHGVCGNSSAGHTYHLIDEYETLRDVQPGRFEVQAEVCMQIEAASKEEACDKLGRILEGNHIPFVSASLRAEALEEPRQLFKVQDLSGEMLNRAVQVALGLDWDEPDTGPARPDYVNDPSLSMPLIEDIRPEFKAWGQTGWTAISTEMDGEENFPQAHGDTMVEAALRVLVMARLGSSISMDAV